MDEPEQAIVKALIKCGLDKDGYSSAALQDIADVIVETLNLTLEQRALADGMGSMSTNWKTGETTAHYRPCTRQLRWVTPWEGVKLSDE